MGRFIGQSCSFDSECNGFRSGTERCDRNRRQCVFANTNNQQTGGGLGAAGGILRGFANFFGSDSNPNDGKLDGCMNHLTGSLRGILGQSGGSTNTGSGRSCSLGSFSGCSSSERCDSSTRRCVSNFNNGNNNNVACGQTSSMNRLGMLRKQVSGNKNMPVPPLKRPQPIANPPQFSQPAAISPPSNSKTPSCLQTCPGAGAVRTKEDQVKFACAVRNSSCKSQCASRMIDQLAKLVNENSCAGISTLKIGLVAGRTTTAGVATSLPTSSPTPAPTSFWDGFTFSDTPNVEAGTSTKTQSGTSATSQMTAGPSAASALRCVAKSDGVSDAFCGLLHEQGGCSSYPSLCEYDRS